MIKRYIFSLFIFFIVTNQLNAQVQNLEFGVIPLEDIQMTQYEAEPDAKAVILAKKSNVEIKSYDGFSVTHKNYLRIKLLDSSSFNLGVFEFDYYSFGGYERITNIQGIVTYPDGNTYTLKNKDIKRERVSREWTKIQFEFPNLQKGAIIEYFYVISVNDIYPMEDFNFQYDIPVRYAEITYTIPKFVKYNISIINKEKATEIKNGFAMRDLPSLKSLPFTDNIDNYRGRIKLIIEGIDTYSGVEGYNTTWEEHAKNLFNYDYFGKQMFDPSNSRNLIAKTKYILVEEIPIEEKIIKLQSYLLSTVKWDGTYDIYAINTLDAAFAAESANSAELNMMMAAMLNQLDIKAVPCLVKLRSNGRFDSANRTLEQFNHMILLVDTGDGTHFIDVLDALKHPYLIRAEALNKEGLVILSEPVWVQLNKSFGKSFHFSEFSFEGRAIKGKIQSKLSGYDAFYERFQASNDKRGSFWEKRLRIKYPRAYVTDYNYQYLNEVNKDFITNLDVTIPDAYEIFKDTLYLNGNIFTDYGENPFSVKDRGYPVDFTFPREENLIVLLEIPENHEVFKLPDQKKIVTEGGMAEFWYSAEVIDQKIQIVRKVILKKDTYEPEEYKGLAELFEILGKHSDERIILVKKLSD